MKTDKRFAKEVRVLSRGEEHKLLIDGAPFPYRLSGPPTTEWNNGYPVVVIRLYAAEVSTDFGHTVFQKDNEIADYIRDRYGSVSNLRETNPAEFSADVRPHIRDAGAELMKMAEAVENARRAFEKGDFSEPS